MTAIKRAGERAAELVRQLLAFGRKQELRPAPLDLNHLVLDLRKLLERLIGEDVRLETPTAEGPIAVRADRGQLEQVLLNLATNARDAMPDGGTLTIETQRVQLRHPEGEGQPEVPAGDYALLRVSDRVRRDAELTFPALRAERDGGFAAVAADPREVLYYLAERAPVVVAPLRPHELHGFRRRNLDQHRPSIGLPSVDAREPVPLAVLVEDALREEPLVQPCDRADRALRSAARQAGRGGAGVRVPRVLRACVGSRVVTLGRTTRLSPVRAGLCPRPYGV